MGLFKTFLKVSAVGSAASLSVFFGATRNDIFTPMDASDPIFKSSIFKKLNPNQNPTSHDLCVRRIELEKIKPELLEKKGKLVEAFCAGVWGGIGYIPQRAILEWHNKNPETADQLWTRKELISNSYEVGTQMTDHFEIVDKDEERIVVRCGDTPLRGDVRPSDGLFEIGAVIKQEEGVAEFTLKSCLFQGEGKVDAPPFNSMLDWLHKQYTKLLMESAVLKNCVR